MIIYLTIAGNRLRTSMPVMQGPKNLVSIAAVCPILFKSGIISLLLKRDEMIKE